MNTLEDQLRIALSARAEAVTESMLTRSLATLQADLEPDADPEPDNAPVLLVPPHRAHRSRRLAAAALAVAAMLLVAFGAVALHRASSHGTVSPAHIRPRSAVPWDKVGIGWTLQEVHPGAVNVPGGINGWLYLIDPDGVPYSICKVPDWEASQGYLFAEPSAWGQPYNTDHVILMRPIDNSRSSLLEIDLRSGTQHAVTVQGHWNTAEFVDAADSSILLNGVEKMVTVSAETGRAGTSFEGTEFFGALISPNRTQVVSGSMTTLSVLDVRTGRLVRKLAPPVGYRACAVSSWLPGTARFVARCERIAKPDGDLTFEFSVDGATSPVRPAVPTGWDEIDLADGKLAIKSGQPQSYRIIDMSFARLTSGGQLDPIAVPEEVRSTDWQLFEVTPAGLVLQSANRGDKPDDMALWNPVTGRFEVLFRAGEKWGPDGGWAGWRTSWP